MGVSKFLMRELLFRQLTSFPYNLNFWELSLLYPQLFSIVNRKKKVSRANKERIKYPGKGRYVTCDYPGCGEVLYRSPKRLTLNRHHYCQTHCHIRPQAEEMKQKLREYHSSPGVKEKQSKKQKSMWAQPGMREKILSRMPRGSAHYRWNGGTSFGEYPPEFVNRIRYRVKRRDNYTCQLCHFCSQNEDKVQSHHIDYNKDNNLEINIVTLCFSCHAKTNINRSSWKLVLDNLMLLGA